MVERRIGRPSARHPLGLPFLLWVAVVTGAAGCGSSTVLMPTPTIYTRGDVKLFEDVPPEFQNNRVEVLYVTDRVPEPPDPSEDASSKEEPVGVRYGSKRSRSAAYGISVVRIGDEKLSWQELVKASESRKRDKDLDLRVVKTTELGRFPPTPKVLVELPPNTVDLAATAPTTAPSTGPSAALTTRQAALKAEVEHEVEQFKRDLAARLAMSPHKEVYLFVHGYNCSFDDGVTTVAQLWHFFGRRGVPVAYTWPAGGTGLLRGYTYDRESSEFTVFHMKEALRVIAACPEVERVNVIAHSRGTDVFVTALRELHLEISGGGRSTRDELKLGSCVLAAPDLDLDVVIQRCVTARLGRVPERFTIYVCKNDEALGISTWLFAGRFRLGGLTSDAFSPQELAVLRASKSVSIVDARVSDTGDYGHSYFHANPAVSSDLVLLMRYKRLAGAEHGRPLRDDAKGFWFIDDEYPDPPKPPSR